jgi:hypothetical protein
MPTTPTRAPRRRADPAPDPAPPTPPAATKFFRLEVAELADALGTTAAALGPVLDRAHAARRIYRPAGHPTVLMTGATYAALGLRRDARGRLFQLTGDDDGVPARRLGGGHGTNHGLLEDLPDRRARPPWELVDDGDGPPEP